MLNIRAARPGDTDAIWAILEPVICAGDTYTLPRDMTREEALAYWMSSSHEVFVAEDDGPGGQGPHILRTYYLRPNQQGGGSHVANGGYMTATGATGKGVARAMCAHSLDHAKKLGFRAMQFNFVVGTNERAFRLWKSFGFEVIGRLPEGFFHPSSGYTDAYVMYRLL